MRHHGEQYHKISLDFFRDVLGKMGTSPVYSERKQVYRQWVSSFGDKNRYKLLNWLLYIAMKFGISDEAFLHSVKMVETALVKFQLHPDLSQSSKVRFMKTKP